jgi:hypothetical protein
LTGEFLLHELDLSLSTLQCCRGVQGDP